MKKIISVLCVVFLAVCLVQAQEDDEAQDSMNRFSIGAGFTYAGSPDSHNFYGGHLDFGITLYRKAVFVQNRFMLRAGGLIIDDVDFSLFTISERLIVGRGDEVAFYIYLEGGAGIYGNENKGSFDDPPAYTFGFGGGFNLGDTEFGGMYFELGYLGHKLEPKTPLAGVIVQAGYRIFF